MDRVQEQQLVDYYSATDKYIKGTLHSQAHQSVFTIISLGNRARRKRAQTYPPFFRR